MSKKKKTPLPTVAQGVYLVDTHCHLDMEGYAQDCSEVIARAIYAGVSTIMTIGIDLASSRAALELARQYPEVYCSLGIHPHNVVDVDESHYRELAEMAKDLKVKAYGEIGLDYVKDYAPQSLQLEHFRRQVDLGKELGLPLIIHDREAHEDTMAVLRAAAPYPAGGVMHCYSGDTQLAQEVVALGFYLSIPGVVTFTNAEILHKVAREIPLDHLLLETDGPFLAPVPYRGKRNEPAYILYTAQQVAQVKGVSLEEVARQTTSNAEKLFNLKERRFE